MDTNIGQVAALPKVAGFRHIIDDGDCRDHGFYLPKQQAGTLKKVCNCGVELVDVTHQDLLGVLAGVSAVQQSLLASIK